MKSLKKLFFSSSRSNRKNDGRRLQLEPLEERQLLSTVGWNATFDQDNSSLTLEGVYNCDLAEAAKGLEIKGFYESDKYATQNIDSESYADITFDEFFMNNLVQKNGETPYDLSLMTLEDNGNEDGDSTTDEKYTFSWYSDNGAFNSGEFNLGKVTYKFNLANGASTNINILANETDSEGTSNSMETYSISVINDNGTLKFNVAEPSITLSNVVKNMSLNDAVAGAKIADVAVEGFGEDAVYTFMIDGEESNAFQVVNGELQLAEDFEEGTSANIVVTVTDGENSVSSEAFNFTVTAIWDVSALNYKFYTLEAVDVNNVISASLFGSNNIETKGTLISTFNNLGANATVTIIGDPLKEEGLFVTASASTNLGEIIFNGGTCKLDHVAVEGTINDDTFTINTESVSVTTPVYTANPYAGLLTYYRDLFGANSQTYLQIANIYNNAFNQLKSIVVTTRTDLFNTVAQANGATIKAAGVQQILINGANGDDDFNVVNLGTNYDFFGGVGTADAISFNAPKYLLQQQRLL